MLSHSELFGLQRNTATFFSLLPADIIGSITPYCLYNVDPTSDIAKALRLVAFGQLTELKAILDQANTTSDKTQLKRLLLQTSDTITRAGLQVKNKTLLACALGAGDMELAAMIIPYFNVFAGGPEERERQVKPYQSCIAALPTQQADAYLVDLINELINLIKTSPHKDIRAELATGDQYDPRYQSPLRKAMNQFRSEMLAPQRRIITTERMHCNYQNLAYADVILDRAWNSLKVTEGDGHDKHRLVARQILGFIELVELPAYERYMFARGQSDEAIAGKEIVRSLDYKYSSELGRSFPDYTDASINSHSGVGFDTYVNICGCNIFAAAGWAMGRAGASGACRGGTLMSSKSNKWEEIYAAVAASTRPSLNK